MVSQLHKVHAQTRGYAQSVAQGVRYLSLHRAVGLDNSMSALLQIVLLSMRILNCFQPPPPSIC